MEIKTSHNSLFYNNNSQNANLMTNIINYSVKKFCDSMGFKISFFYQYLPYSEKQQPKMFNPNDYTKHLKVDDLITILDNLDSKHQKLILDFLAQRYNAVFISNIDLEQSNQSLEHILLSITSIDGELANTFLQSIQDGEIDQQESKLLDDVAYRLRSLLRIFEHRKNNSTERN